MSFAARSRMAAAAMSCMIISLGNYLPDSKLIALDRNHENRRAMKPKASKKKRGKSR